MYQRKFYKENYFVLGIDGDVPTFAYHIFKTRLACLSLGDVLGEEIFFGT